MKSPSRAVGLLIACAVAAGMYGCGGSAGGDAGSSPPVTISGTAAAGAVFVGATIYVFDSRGVEVGSTSNIDPVSGAYSLTLQSGAVAPMVVIASRSSADGQTETMVSVIGSQTQTTVNITPITSLLASLLSPSGDPVKLLDELKSGAATISPASITAAVDEINRILSSVLTATGTTASDPLTASFTADGTTYDRLLDSITVSFTPASDSSTNIDIGVKTTSSDSTQPVSTSFSSTDTSSASLPDLTGSTLVESGTSMLISGLLTQLNNCYALPLSSRIRSGGTTAADVVATECRKAFFGDDPASFKSNGAIVEAGGAFKSLFANGGTGVVFSQGTYEFTRSNGDVVAGYKSRDVLGNETFDTFALRKDTDGKLKLIGNQYAYPGGVTAYQQLRQFVTLGQSAYNYYSTGYNLNVTDVVVGGNSIFDRVVVTPPSGPAVVLRPSSGSSFLSIAPDGVTASGTSFIRLARAYANQGDTSDPKLVDGRMFFSTTRYSDEDIQKIPAQSVWKFEYYLKTDTATPVDPPQYYKTRARAMTIAEMRAVGLPSMIDEFFTSVSAAANAVSGNLVMTEGEIVDVIGPSGANAWTVATGQLPPTQITVFGRYSGANFNDTVKFGSTTRKARVPCTRGGVGDNHCHANGDGTYGPGYAANAALSGIHLWSRDIAGREFANFYAMYKLTLP